MYEKVSNFAPSKGRWLISSSSKCLDVKTTKQKHAKTHEKEYTMNDRLIETWFVATNVSHLVSLRCRSELDLMKCTLLQQNIFYFYFLNNPLFYLFSLFFFVKDLAELALVANRSLYFCVQKQGLVLCWFRYGSNICMRKCLTLPRLKDVDWFQVPRSV